MNRIDTTPHRVARRPDPILNRIPEDKEVGKMRLNYGIGILLMRQSRGVSGAKSMLQPQGMKMLYEINKTAIEKRTANQKLFKSMSHQKTMR